MLGEGARRLCSDGGMTAAAAVALGGAAEAAEGSEEEAEEGERRLAEAEGLLSLSRGRLASSVDLEDIGFHYNKRQAAQAPSSAMVRSRGARRRAEAGACSHGVAHDGS